MRRSTARPLRTRGLALVATATALSLFPSCTADPDLGTPPTTSTNREPEPAVRPHVHPRGTEHPNILLITVDDASVGDVSHLPHLQHLVVARGTSFVDALAPTPMCAPSRASLLTGQYAHNHGVLTVEGEAGGVHAFSHQENTLPVWLQRVGYRTLFVGKYLNQYGEDGDPTPEPGWDQWRPAMGASTYDYLHPVLDINGRLSPRQEYGTDLFTDQATLLLARRAQRTRPWFMWLNYVAPHHGTPLDAADASRAARGVLTPYVRPRDRGRSASIAFPREPDMFVVDPRHAHLVGRRADRRGRQAVREGYHRRLDALLAVDDALVRVVATLRRTGQLGRTILVFTSDNGFLTGQHGFYGKLVFYDGSVRIPVVMAGPGIPVHRVVRSTITNPDLATTIAAIAGARPGRPPDGVDVRPLMRTGTRFRPVPIEAYPVHGGTRPVYTGIRYAQFTYVRLRHGVEELFDRTVDPYELVDVAGRPGYAEVLRRMRSWRRLYRHCAGSGCPQLPRGTAPARP